MANFEPHLSSKHLCRMLFCAMVYFAKNSLLHLLFVLLSFLVRTSGASDARFGVRPAELHIRYHPHMSAAQIMVVDMQIQTVLKKTTTLFARFMFDRRFSAVSVNGSIHIVIRLACV